MKINQIVICNPENLAGISLAFERGGRLVIDAVEPMTSAILPRPTAPRKDEDEKKGEAPV